MKSNNCVLPHIIEPLKSLINMESMIFFYGYSLLSRTVADIIKKDFPKLHMCYIDRCAGEIGYEDKGIYSLEDIKQFSDKQIFIFSEHAKEMEQSLLSMGLRRDVDYYVLIDLSEWWETEKQHFKDRHKQEKLVTLEKQIDIMLGLLKNIDTICSQNNLTYFLDSGTLIGAVRDGGFIPWDHDIDIIMPFEDMIALQRIIEAETDYVFEFYKTDNSYLHWFPRIVVKDMVNIERICGNHILETAFGIDVFVLGGYGNTLEEAEKHLKQHKELWECWRKYIVGDLKWDKKLLEKIEAFQKEFTWDSKYVGPVHGTDMPFWYLEKSKIEPAQKMQYEGFWFNVPNDYDARLRIEYGDYMQVPSKEEQQRSIDKQRIVYKL